MLSHGTRFLARKTTTAWVSLSLIPSIVALIGGYFLWILGPIYAGLRYRDYDPAYQYLLNGLSFAYGYPPGHTDHPGTPLQLLTAAALLLSHGFSGQPKFDLIDAVIADPETFVFWLSLLLLALIVASNWFLGWQLMRQTGSVALGIIAQLGLLFLGTEVSRIAYLAPEAMLLAISAVMVGIVSKRLFDSKAVISTGEAVAVGMLSGIGVMTKVTFVPMLALLLLIGLNRRLLVAIIAAVATTGVFILTIFPVVDPMLNWFNNVATHKGIYGGGEAGLIDIASIPASLGQLWRDVPIFYAGLAASVFAIPLVLFRVRGAPPVRWTDIVLACIPLLVFVLQFAIVLKHFRSHYIMPIIPLATVIIAWLIWLAAPYQSDVRRRIRALVAGGLLLVCLQQSYAVAAQYAAARPAWGAQLKEMDDILGRYPGALVVGTYRAAEFNFALQFAIGYTDHQFAQKVNARLRNNLAVHGGLYGYTTVALRQAGKGAGYFELKTLNRYLDEGNKILLVFPRAISFHRFECAAQFQLSRDHICELRRVRD
jgi:hypothetical protein